MVKRVKKWLGEGKDVRIFTARIHKDSPKVREPIEAWSKKHLGKVLPITNVKDPDCEEIWDDIAVGVYENEGIPIQAGREPAERKLKKDLRKIAK